MALLSELDLKTIKNNFDLMNAAVVGFMFELELVSVLGVSQKPILSIFLLETKQSTNSLFYKNNYLCINNFAVDLVLYYFVVM